MANGEPRTQRLERFMSGPWPFILPGITLYLAFSIYPIIYQFYVAMTNMTISTIYSANWVGLDNFVFLANDPVFRDVLLFTFAFVAVTVPTQFALGFGLALLLDQQLRGRAFFRISIIMPMAISSIIVGLMWRLMLHESQVGAINAILVGLGFDAVSWFSDPTMARISVFIVNMWQSVGYTMVFMLGGLQTIPAEVVEAATVDGASVAKGLAHQAAHAAPNRRFGHHLELCGRLSNFRKNPGPHQRRAGPGDLDGRLSHVHDCVRRRGIRRSARSRLSHRRRHVFDRYDLCGLLSAARDV